MHEMLGVKLCPETVRRVVERHGKKMARFQEEDTASEQAFREAPGEVEFTIDAGKANTREEGWKDLKIGVIAKRESGKPTKLDDYKKQHLPAATMVLAFAMIAPSKEFRQGWRERFKRLGVTSMASIHVLADGANWIWKAVGRVLTGCVQTLDFYHACQHLNKCAERIHGERIQGERVSKTCATSIAYRRGRSLLLSQGWGGVCQWVAELLAATDSTDVADEKRRRKATDRMIGYFSKHLSRLNYAERLKPVERSAAGKSRASQNAGPAAQASRSPLEQEKRPTHGQPRVRPPLVPVGRLLANGRLITPRAFGCTP